MNALSDLDGLAGVLSFLPKELFNTSLNFEKGECVIAGGIAPFPMFAKFEGRLTAEGGRSVPPSWVRSE